MNKIDIEEVNFEEQFYYEITKDNMVKIKDIKKQNAIIIIPDYFNGKPVTEIDDYLYTSEIIKEIEFGKNIRKIGKYAFCGCVNLEKVSFKSTNINIGKDAFSNTKWIEKNELIILENEILYKYNGNHEKFEIPKGIKVIYDYAFSRKSVNDTDNLKSVIIPDSVIAIGESAFADRNELTEVIIGNNVETIGKKAFLNCSNLEIINIPEKVEKLESQVFDGCSSLETLYIPKRVNKINLSSLPLPRNNPLGFSVKVDKDNQNYSDIDGVLFDKEKKILLYFSPNLKIKNYIIPETVEIIGNKAFFKNDTLESITFSNNIKEIKKFAFSKCTQLQTVNFNASVEKIEASTFEDCNKLQKVYFNKSMPNLGDNMFENCSNIEEIIFPNDLVCIGNRTFATNYGKIKMEKVEVPKTVKEIGLGCFAGVKEIVIYDTITPNAKKVISYKDEGIGKPNSNLGYIGLYTNSVNRPLHTTTWNDHTIIVKSSETDELLYKVWMGGCEETIDYRCALVSSWGKNATFNFEKLDEVFDKIKKFDNKIKVLTNRLKYPVSLTEEHKEKYLKYLKRSTKKLGEGLIDENNLEGLLKLLSKLEEYKLISKTNIDKLIDYANENKSLEILSYLMNYKNKYLK